MTRIVVVSAGIGVPSSTRLLADRLGQAVVGALGDHDVVVDHVELRPLAHPLADRVLTGFAGEELEAALTTVADADGLVRNFVRLAAEKGRAGELAEFSQELDALVARAQNRLAVELTTAYELSETEASSIVATIEKASGRTVEATRAVDPGLPGALPAVDVTAPVVGRRRLAEVPDVAVVVGRVPVPGLLGRAAVRAAKDVADHGGGDPSRCRVCSRT